MKQVFKLAVVAGATLISTSVSWADTLQTHRIPAVLALEAVGEAVAACAKQGYRETVTVLDADGATIATLRGDGAGIHTLDSAHDKAYTSVSFKNDTIALAGALAAFPACPSRAGPIAFVPPHALNNRRTLRSASGFAQWAISPQAWQVGVVQ